MQTTDWIGWGASAILIATLLRQVPLQWRDGEDARLSSWLFAGQIVVGIACMVYRLLLHNGVFVFGNSAVVLTAVLRRGGRMHGANARGD